MLSRHAGMVPDGGLATGSPAGDAAPADSGGRRAALTGPRRSVGSSLLARFAAGVGAPTAPREM